jgi:hypothetical protein
MIRIEPVLAIDPGKLTGLAWITRVDDEVNLTDSAEKDQDSIIDAIRPTVACWNRQPGDSLPLRVVMERFVITIETGKKSQEAAAALETIGAVKQLCRESGYPLDAIAWQTPAAAKNAFPNPKLKRLGLWHRGGAGHALDAIRHGSLYLVQSGWTDSRML